MKVIIVFIRVIIQLRVTDHDDFMDSLIRLSAANSCRQDQCGAISIGFVTRIVLAII